MIDLDHLINLLHDRSSVTADDLGSALMTLDEDHTAMLSQYLDPDEIDTLLDATGIDWAALPANDLNTALEALAEVAAELAEEEVKSKPAAAS